MDAEFTHKTITVTEMTQPAAPGVSLSLLKSSLLSPHPKHFHFPFRFFLCSLGYWEAHCSISKCLGFLPPVADPRAAPSQRKNLLGFALSPCQHPATGHVALVHVQPTGKSQRLGQRLDQRLFPAVL